MKRLDIDGHEKVIEVRDRAAGLHAIIAIHDTTLGSAIGGTRMWSYDNEQLAIDDALRLSRAMTYKAASAELPFGGGKAVIIGDPATQKSEALLLAYAAALEELDGEFVTGEDAGTTAADMLIMSRATRFVVWASEHDEHPMPTASVTAFGVLRGIQACLKERTGAESFMGVRIAIQRLGKVGSRLARLLHDEGAELIVTDTDTTLVWQARRELDARAVRPDDIYDVDADLFSPCALGGTINAGTIARLQAPIVAGAANNQLRESADGERLRARGILFAPDYVINSGGLISALLEMGTWTRERTMEKTGQIFERLLKIFEIARNERLPTNVVADRLAEETLAEGRRMRQSAS